MTLYKAIQKEDLDMVKKLLTDNPSLIDTLDDNNVPMSFVAAATGNEGIVRYIVEYSRASMNTTDSDHRNILHYCAMSGNVELARYLVEKVGMSPVSADKVLTTPFDIAKENGHKALETYFEEVCGASIDEMYRNPIRTGMFPDPSIVRVGDDYYMVNSSFIFFPCIPISHSRDLVNWRIIGHAITNPEWAMLSDLEGGRGYWAPDISYHDGYFYITATYRFNDTGPIYRKQIVVKSERPEGPYSEPAIIDEDGIDPSIFNDEDGRRYMLLNRGARILELDQTGTKQISEARLLYYGSQKRAPEGPHLLKKDGWYYLFLAEGGTGPGHRVTVARSRELHGNYEPCPNNPIMRQDDPSAAIQRCGHGKPVQTQNGQWYMVYLCGRMIGEGFSMLGRETALDPISWTADGWPHVNELKGPSTLQKKPDLPECQWEDEPTGFGNEVLSKEWMFPRVPTKDAYKLEEGRLLLKGSKKPLSSRHARNTLVRRQKHFSFAAVTEMGIVPLGPNQDCGLISYYDENTWVKFALFSDEHGTCSLRCIEHIGKENKEILDPLILDIDFIGSIYLKVEVDHLQRKFSYSFGGSTYKEFGCLNNVYYLCDEGIKLGKRFTGAMVGIYAFAGEHELEVPFESFDYRPLKELTDK